jgi:hypothetical protein
MLSGCVTEIESASVTFTVKLKEPRQVVTGVPLMYPLPGASDRQDGSGPRPLTMLQVYGPTPPLKPNWNAKGTATVASGNCPVVRIAKGCAPVPVRPNVCGLPPALSVMLAEAMRVPKPVGLNVTLIVQVPLAATEPPL